jgi:hypothetical protein
MLEQHPAQPEKAKGEGSSHNQTGATHLAAVSALEETLEQCPSREERRVIHNTMLGHADAALRIYADLRLAWGRMQAHLAKADILACIARDQESKESRAEYVLKSLDHCHRAMTILGEAANSGYPVIADAHAMAIAILLRLQSLVEETEPRQMLDGAIQAYSENLGAALAWNFRHQAEGNDLLFMARLLSTLAREASTSSVRLEGIERASVVAARAAEMLRLTGNREQARAAIDLAAKMKEKSVALEAAATPRMGYNCPICGRENKPGKKYCTHCGAPLG